MRKFYVLATVAVAAALWFSFNWEPGSIREKLVRLETKDALPELADQLANEPPEVQSVFLSYADDRLLLIKAEAALLKYPQLARRILPMYGDEPEFQEILRKHGEAVLIPINYFVENRVRSIEVMDYARRTYEDVSVAARRLWKRSAPPDEGGGDSPQAQAEVASDEALAPSVEDRPLAINGGGLSASERGWYAVQFIKKEGAGFLGQFVFDDSGKTHWIQTERLLENIGSFFASGFRTLETKSRAGEEIEAADVGWAAVDALVIFSAAKVARVGKTGTVAKPATGTARAGAASSRAAKMAGRGTKWAKYAKWPVFLGLTYTVDAHPSLISDVLAGLAKAVALPVWLV
jgi:hypothetical protein